MSGGVEDWSGTTVVLVSGTSCLAQLYGQPVYCGAMATTISVDLGSTPVPPYGSLVDVYGLTAPAGTITPLEIVVRP
jgi:hypothetical protein